MTQLPVFRKEDIADPASLFQILLNGSVEEIRHHLRVTEWFDDETVEQAEPLFEEFLQDYEQILAKLSAAFRAPDFNGSYEDEGYPEQLESVAYLAYWLFEDRAIYLICDQQDQETPIALALGMASRGEFTPQS